MDNQYYLYCGNSMSADAMDGSHVLVCFSCKDYEGKEMQVDDEGCCENYNAMFIDFRDLRERTKTNKA